MHAVSSVFNVVAIGRPTAAFAYFAKEEGMGGAGAAAVLMEGGRK